MSAHNQRRQVMHKAALLEGRAGEGTAVCPGTRQYTHEPPPKKSQLSEPAEKWSIHTQDTESVFKD